jgi:hypothetical protein
MCVTINGVWIGEWIYWPIMHTTRNYTQLQRYRWSPPCTNHYTLSLLNLLCLYSRSLATSSNSGDSSASRAWVLLSQPPLQKLTRTIAPSLLSLPCRAQLTGCPSSLLFITPRRGPRRQHPGSPVAAGTCLPSSNSVVIEARLPLCCTATTRCPVVCFEIPAQQRVYTPQ